MSPPIPNCAARPTISERFECVNQRILKVAEKNNHPPKTEFNSEKLDALSSGTFSERFKTGFEPCLAAKLLQEPDRSVGPDKLFEMAYNQCCNHSVECALQSTYNILENGRTSSQRNELPVQKKLALMREADNFGAYYHFYGLAYYTYMSNSFYGWVAMQTLHYVDYVAHDVCMDTGSFNCDKQMDYIEQLIDVYGHEVGASLKRSADVCLYNSMEIKACDPEMIFCRTTDKSTCNGA